MQDHCESTPLTPQLLAAAPTLLEACELELFYLTPYATGESELRSARLLQDAVQQAHGCCGASELSTSLDGRDTVDMRVSGEVN